MYEIGRLGPKFKIITRRVGAGLSAPAADVKRVKQLLAMAGHSDAGGSGGRWTETTTEALNGFQEEVGLPVQPYVDPQGDYTAPGQTLLTLALYAKVLFPLTYSCGQVGLEHFVKWCQDNKPPYSWVDGDPTSSQLAFGLAGFPTFGISVTLEEKLFSPSNPITFNCTSFACIGMSLWQQGHIHTEPYEAYQAMGTRSNPVNTVPISARYNFRPLDGKAEHTICTNLEEVIEVVKRLPINRLYHTPAVYAKDTVDRRGRPHKRHDMKHDMLLVGGKVYDYTDLNGRDKCMSVVEYSAKYKITFQKGYHVLICGPSPL